MIRGEFCTNRSSRSLQNGNWIIKRDGCFRGYCCCYYFSAALALHLALVTRSAARSTVSYCFTKPMHRLQGQILLVLIMFAHLVAQQSQCKWGQTFIFSS